MPRLKLIGEYEAAASLISSINSFVVVASLELIALRRKKWRLLRDSQLCGADGQLLRKWEPHLLEWSC